MRTVRMLAALLCALGVLTGCTTVVDGTGSSERSGSGSGSVPGPGPTDSTGSTGSGSAAPGGQFTRAQHQTAAGDPSTADLCGALDLARLRALGLTVARSEQQFVPGCGLSVTGRTGGPFYVSSFVSETAPQPASGRRSRTVAGLVVYEYRASGGDCERDIVAGDLIVKIHSYSGTSDTLSCTTTTEIANQYARALAAKSVPRATLAANSLTRIDFCAVLRAVDLSGLPGLAGAPLAPEPFDTGCDVKVTKGQPVFVEFVVIPLTKTPAGAVSLIDGHRLYAEVSGASCTVTSPQDTASSDTREALVVQKFDAGVSCTDLTKLLAAILTKLGRQ